MKSVGTFIFGLLSVCLSFVGALPVVLRWITERLPIFANVHALKNEAARVSNDFVAMLAPNSKPYSTAPPGLFA